ncbi:membrane-bound lytic murein transglycosylase D [mine drainage metagenome]|uniref:Membrane-bound lytic murein transglycosylase D n=1 Tax=mine drainage metagenome TaxID=410659 RepID=A0A1J5PI68_9ZZZZ
MSESELRAVNNIPARMLIKAGSTLVVRRNAVINHDITERVADNSYLALTPAIILNKTTVKARKKETVVTLARRYRVNATDVAQWNKVGTAAAFRPGQKIVLYLPIKAKTKKLGIYSSKTRVSKGARKNTSALLKKTPLKKTPRLARSK